MISLNTYSPTRSEEIANALSHGLGFVLALAASPLLVWHAMHYASGTDVVAASIFGASMLVLYAMSALYHALPQSAGKRVFQRLDHAAIFIFIAGSYTPFSLGVLHGAWGWTLFGLVWGLAALGVIVKLSTKPSSSMLSTALYLLMGWVVLIAIYPLVQRMPSTGLAWLIAGGLAYTLGAVVFAFDERIRYAHFVWHLFVLLGSACHFCAALCYGYAVMHAVSK